LNAEKIVVDDCMEEVDGWYWAVGSLPAMVVATIVVGWIVWEFGLKRKQRKERKKRQEKINLLNLSTFIINNELLSFF